MFSVSPVAQPVVREMEMHSVANFSDFFPLKCAQTLFSLRESRTRGLAFPACAHTSLSLLQHRYYVACFSNFTCKYSQNHSTAIVIILCVFYLIR